MVIKKLIFSILIIAAFNFTMGYKLESKTINFALQKAEAAWWEFGESAKELEYAVNTTPCTADVYVRFEYGVEVSVQVEPPSISLGGGVSYERRSVAGTQAHCMDGKQYRDCSDAIGMINSILGDGDCVPN